jgi:hypothetical protein
LQNELDREDAIHNHLATLGRSVSVRLCRNIPSHMKSRLVSLKLDPGTHPVPSDTILGLMLGGLSSAWTFPHLDLTRRIYTALLFLVIPVLPRSVLGRVLDWIFMEMKRWRASNTVGTTRTAFLTLR